MAVIVFGGDGSKTAIDALNGRTIGGRKIVASTDLANDRLPDLHPVFGEVFSLKQR